MKTLALALVSALALAGRAAAVPAPTHHSPTTTHQYDLGAAGSPAEKGYTAVTPATAYSAARGFGWKRTGDLQERDRGGPDALRGDLVYGRGAGASEFAVDLPNGAYRVTLVTGDVQAADHVLDVTAEGQPVLQKLHPEAGEFLTAVFGASVADGQLNLLFSSPEGNWVLSAITVEPVETLVGLEKPRLAGKRYSRQAAPAGRRARLMVPAADVRPLHLLKPADFANPGYPTRVDYLRILERFPLYAERGWHPNYQGLADVGYFGDEDSAEMGLRAMGNFLFTYALLATDPGYDPRPSGVSRETILDHCRQCLRYLTRAHVTGDLTCADGRKWGNHWQSSWWVSRMAGGAQLLWNHLSAEERAAVERVVAFEADRQGRRTPPGGAARDTKSEENAWDTESLAWALALLPTHPNAPLWETKLRDFAMNTLSVPADARNPAPLEGKPISEWVKTANVHDDFTIENHGAYHFCYMSCPLHNLAWSYYALRTARRSVPPQLWHHYREVWNALARTFLPDGRFAYLSGKDWPRYAYGLSFILPVTVVVQLEFQAPEARLFERLRVMALEREQVLNADGTFFGGRFTRNQMADRLLEYETDAYALLGLNYLLHYRGSAPVAPMPLEQYLERASGAWSSADSGFCAARAGDLFTSFSWRTLSGRGVQGLFIPGDASLAEWGADQLAGALAVQGYSMSHPRRVTHNDRVSAEQFITVGSYDEGEREGKAATVHYLAFASLPRERVAVLVERVVAADDITVTRNEGLRFYLPNDLFNGNARTLYASGARRRIVGVEPGRRETREVRLPGPWLNVDGRLGFAQVGARRPFVVRDAPARNVAWNSLLTESIVVPATEGEKRFALGETVRESIFVLVAGDAAATARAARAQVVDAPALGKDALVVRLRAPAGGEYYVGANFGTEAARATLNTGGDWGVPVTMAMEALSGSIVRVPFSR